MPAGEAGAGQWVGDNSGPGRDQDSSGENDHDSDDPNSPATATRFRTVSDPIGTQPWSSRFDANNSDGQLIAQAFQNRDGSTLVAEYNPTGERPFDSRIIVQNADGSLISFTNVGPVQTIANATTGEILTRTAMTSGGLVALGTSTDTPTALPASFALPTNLPAAMTTLAMLGAAAIYYAWVNSSGKSGPTTAPNSTAPSADVPVFAIEQTREYNKNAEVTGAYVGAVAVATAQSSCPAYDQMQAWTNEGYKNALQTMPGASPQQIGIATHAYVAAQVRALKDPTLQVAPGIDVAPLLKPVPGSIIQGNILADVNEYVGNGTVCVYDFKTGFAGLPAIRADEFAKRTLDQISRTPALSRVLVITMRPR